MADDLADYPLVVLENDYPEQVGKMGLFDYLMPVGTTGVVFVAAMPGRLYPWGPTFSAEVQRASNLSAASTLVQMGWISAQPLAFLRNALQMSQTDVATLEGVLLATVQGWEDGSVPVPRLVWRDLANRVMQQSGRSMPPDQAMCPNMRPRKIRVFPNLPMVSDQVAQDSSCPEPVSLVGPNCLPLVPPLC